MSRSSWKFISFRKQDINYYWKFLFYSKDLFFYNNTRNITISNLNCISEARVHQGKQFTNHKLTVLHLGYKTGQLSKTKKPFFFRSKKKYVTKKKQISELLFYFWFDLYTKKF